MQKQQQTGIITSNETASIADQELPSYGIVGLLDGLIDGLKVGPLGAAEGAAEGVTIPLHWDTVNPTDEQEHVQMPPLTSRVEPSIAYFPDLYPLQNIGQHS